MRFLARPSFVSSKSADFSASAAEISRSVDPLCTTARWNRPFAAVTSNLPLAAIVQGRNRLSLAELGWWRLLIAIVAYAALFPLHRYIAGVPITLG